MMLTAPIIAPRPNRVDCGPLATSMRWMSNSSTYEPRDLEIDTPSWNTDTRGSTVASPLSEVMPRITKPGLLGDWFWTWKPGTKADSLSNSCTPSLSSMAPE
jgi:hypothetical protein